MASVVEVASAFDTLAPIYDEAFSDPSSLRENETVMGIIGDTHDLNVLDIGCGTGLFLDYNQPIGYCGIDPSAGMLARLKEKHPAYAEKVIQTTFEEFRPVVRYDLIVCLFAAANYINPMATMRIPDLVKAGGRWVVMFANEGYTTQVVEKITGIRVGKGYRPGIIAPVPGIRRPMNNYTIISGTKSETIRI